MAKRLTRIGFRDTVLGVRSQEMKEVTSTSQFGYYKKFVIHTEHIVQSNDIDMAPKLAQHIDFFLQFGNVLGVTSQHDTFAGKLLAFATSATRVTLRFAPRGNAHLTVGSFPND